MKILNPGILVFVLIFSIFTKEARAELQEPKNTFDTLYVSTASTDITPPIGVPLAGHGSFRRRNLNPFSRIFNRYSTYLKSSKGTFDPIRAKVMILKRGDKKLLFLSADLVAMTKKFQKELATHLEPLGFQREGIFVSGTHTHNGPGAIADNPFWEIVAVDRFVPEIYYGILSEIVELVRRADKDLEPGFLFAYDFQAKGLQRNRRKDHAVHVYDPTTNVLFAKNWKGQWIGGLVNLAIHGTVLHQSTRHFSADAPGGIERHTEGKLYELNHSMGTYPTVLFINGAEGDVAPIKDAQYDRTAIEEIGASFAAQAVSAMPNARVIEPRWTIKNFVVPLGSAYLRFKGCMESDIIRWLVWGGLYLDARLWFPKTTWITSVSLGDMIMMTWPGEPTTALGLKLKEIASQVGAKQSWVLGLTNDHLSYFVTPEEYQNGGYESCASLFGPEGGNKIVEGYRQMLKK